MGYRRVKFQIVRMSQRFFYDQRVAELKYWCQQFHQYGLTPVYQGRSCGNLSFRLRKKQSAFIITASGIRAKDNLSDDCFVKVWAVDLEKLLVKVSGVRDPSSESMLHFAIYQRRPEVNAIFHGHDREILLWADKLKLPQTIKYAPYGTNQLTQRVLDVIDNHCFLVIKRHGFLSLNRDMQRAGALALAISQKCLRLDKKRCKN